MKENIYLSFCICLIFNMIIFSCINFLTNDIILFHVMGELKFIVCIYYIFFIVYVTDRYLAQFWNLNIANNATINMDV